MQWKASLLTVGLLVVLAPAICGSQSAAPSCAPQVEALMRRAIANQKRNDEALGSFERFERRVSDKGSKNEEHRLFRLIPAGARHEAVLVSVRDERVATRDYAGGLREVRGIVDEVIAASQPPQVSEQEIGYAGSGILDELLGAFSFRLAGREQLHGRPALLLVLTPQPRYKSTSRLSRAFPYARARLWIDERSEQFARIEIDIVEDISIGAGLLGKIDKGGRVFLEQAEVAEGLWFGRAFGLELKGRKLFFRFDKSRFVVVTSYRHVGSPEQVRAMLDRELAALTAPADAASRVKDMLALPPPSRHGFAGLAD